MRKEDVTASLWDMESASVPSQSARRLSIAEKIGNNLTPWRVLKFLLAATSIALALGWARYVAHGYVYLPAFPDYIDVALGVCVGVFLFVDYFREVRK